MPDEPPSVLEVCHVDLSRGECYPIQISSVGEGSMQNHVVRLVNCDSSSRCHQFDGQVYETLNRLSSKSGTDPVQTEEVGDGSLLNPSIGHSINSNNTSITKEKCNKDYSDQNLYKLVGAENQHNLSSKLPENFMTTYKQTERNICRVSASDLEQYDKARSTVTSSLDHSSTICKLSFIPVTNGKSESSSTQPIQSLYYILQNKNGKTPCYEQNQDSNIYFPFQTSSAVSLQFSPRNTAIGYSSTKPTEESISLRPGNSFPTGDPNINNLSCKDDASTILCLNLEPLTDTEIIKKLEDPHSQKMPVENDKPVKPSKFVQRKKRLRKSESFSETGGEKLNENVRKFSLGAISFDQDKKLKHSDSSCSRQHKKMDKDEIARILTKLGPLPPIPFTINSESETNPVQKDDPGRNKYLDSRLANTGDAQEHGLESRVTNPESVQFASSIQTFTNNQGHVENPRHANTRCNVNISEAQTKKDNSINKTVCRFSEGVGDIKVQCISDFDSSRATTKLNGDDIIHLWPNCHDANDIKTSSSQSSSGVTSWVQENKHFDTGHHYATTSTTDGSLLNSCQSLMLPVLPVLLAEPMDESSSSSHNETHNYNPYFCLESTESLDE